MECFGFELTLEDEIENGEWRDRSDRYSGKISRVRAAGHGYEIIFLVKQDSSTDYILPDAVLTWPMDGVLEEVTHKHPLYTPGWECGGQPCHELRMPLGASSGDASEERIEEPALMTTVSPDFLDEMQRLGIELALYEEAVEEEAAPAHKGNYCVVLPEADPLLVCAVFVGEKVIPWLRASQ